MYVFHVHAWHPHRSEEGSQIPLELGLQMVVSLHRCARNLIQVLFKNNKMFSTAESSLHLLNVFSVLN